MGDTVTQLEHRVRQVVDRLKALDGERLRLTHELQGLREADRDRRETLAGAAATLEALAQELGPETGREDA